ncbi:DUF5666 domain-containing protein [Kitasatospora sp. MAP5-34]|uniref:DUF5666 domain-containing protein n=1 Tax=Kitasatospora sp. MAP5-34 TaxID=3035102 RepID=UPI00247634C1|nr:DUF5666 domain-containing protein [Kitasatospora sp. MAP5-34]MDH6576482.1 hypothetical protein [Kitasatospora sp. MAP5-34]
MPHENDPNTELLATPPDARDITAELAAAPRRKLPWLSLGLAGAAIATAAFAGGAWYEKGNGTTTGTSTRAAGQGARGAGGGAGGYGGGAGGGTRRSGQGGAGGGFARGTVKAVDGSTVYLTDANGNTIKVTTAATTKIQLSKDGQVADLQPGQSVVVVGTPDASGGYAATQLTEGGTTGFGGGGGGGGFGGGGGGGTRTPSGG